MNLKRTIEKSFGIYHCAKCGKQLRIKNISCIGPYALVFCDDSVCRGASKFIARAMENEILQTISQRKRW